jgi:HK97 gp10 family phage protein
MSIKISGVKELEKALDELKSAKEYQRALQKGCLIIERAAKQKAPKGNGDLRNSIQHKIEAEGDELVGVIYTNLLYAPYVEFGTGIEAEDGGRQDVPWCYEDEEGEWHTTKGMKPIPFMRPALNENKKEVLKMLKESK